MARYIFLDIDGVMNNEQDILHKKEEGIPFYDAMFNELAWKRLSILCKRADAKVVLSSSWRHAVKFDAIGNVLLDDNDDKLTNKLIKHFNKYDIPLIGCTSTGFNGNRGRQILDYVLTNFHGLEDEWVVLDDELFDMEEVLPMDHVFKTEWATGLQDKHIDDILHFWGIETDGVYVYLYDDRFDQENYLPFEEPQSLAPDNWPYYYDGKNGFYQMDYAFKANNQYLKNKFEPHFIVTNMPYFLSKATWNNKIEGFNAYIWSFNNDCYYNIQHYTERELRPGHDLHKLYINGEFNEEDKD